MTPLSSGGRRSAAILILATMIAAAAYVFIYATGRADRPIRSDGFSYYVYLPAWFIYHDPTLAAVADDCCGGEFPPFTAIIRWPGTRRWVDAHPIGVAVMQTPFFLMAHALTRWSNLTPDGFTLYYQHAAGLAGLAWTVAGLWTMRALLRRHFTDRATAATLAALLFGTSLFHYATYDSSYSHAYSFFLIATLLDLTDRWHGRRSRTIAVLLGLVSGLIVLTRHTNLLFLLFVPLYAVANSGIRETVHALRERARELLLMAAVAALVIAPQLALYYQATGRVLVSSYGDLGFDFAHPHIIGVLVSVQKGLFFWSPLLVLAVAGFLRRSTMARNLLVPAAVVLTANTYVIASWWDWQFGASFGHRGFVDALPVFGVGLASTFEWASARRARTVAISIIVVLAVGMSVIHMIQYWNGVLPMSDLTWPRYRAVFLRFK
jgi:hypothetical protein